MLVYPAFGLGLALATLTSASPIIHPREDDNTTTGPPTDSILNPKTVELLETVAQLIGLPSAAVAYTSPKGDGVWTYGNRSVEGDALDADTHFPLASNSKLFLSTTLAWLAEKNTTLPNGRVYTLDMPLKDFVPDFACTMIMLRNSQTPLTSCTGLPPHNFAINPDDTAKTWMERARYLKPIHGLRQGFVYSNANFAIATYIVEVITGRSYYDVLDEYIFKPLDMDASSNHTELKSSGAEISQGWVRQDVNYTQCSSDSIALASANDTRSASGSGSDSLAALVPPPSCLGVTEAFEFWTDGAGQEWGAGANVIATGNDMVKWMKALVNPDPIPLSVLERVETPPYPNEAGLGYALGTVASPYRGYLGSTHDGALPGSNSLTLRIRNESVGVFAWSSDDSYASAFYNLALPAVLDDLLDLPPVEVDNSTESGGDSSAGDPNADPLAGLPVRLPPPADARPPPDMSSLLDKTFIAPGYAPLTISSIDLTNIDKTESAGIPFDFLQIDVSSLQQVPFDGQVLYANWGQTVANYVFFTHFDGPIYNVSIVNGWSRLGPDYSTVLNGNYLAEGDEGTDTSYIGKWWGGPSAVVADNGIGFFDGFWAPQGTVGNIPIVEEGVEEAAEVFFTRQ